MRASWQEVLLGARIADLADLGYRNTLALATLLELLVEKGLVSREEFRVRAGELDRAAGGEPPQAPPAASAGSLP